MTGLVLWLMLDSFFILDLTGMYLGWAGFWWEERGWFTCLN